MNTVAIYGSPRLHKNSSALPNRIVDATEQRGTAIRRFELDALNRPNVLAEADCSVTSCLFNSN